MKALYRAYAGPLLQVVRRCIADRGLSEARVDAEGVVHETFEAMLKTRDPIRNPSAWLSTVARRLVGKTVAHQQQLTNSDPFDLLDTSGALWTSVVPHASIEDSYNTRMVLDAIVDLPDRQRTAVYLSKVQGWTHAEIGDHLQCATATVGVHVHRGISRVVGMVARNALLSVFFTFSSYRLILQDHKHDVGGVLPAGSNSGFALLVALLPFILPHLRKRIQENKAAAIAAGIVTLTGVVSLACVTFAGIWQSVSLGDLCGIMAAAFGWVFFRFPGSSEDAETTATENEGGN